MITNDDKIHVNMISGRIGSGSFTEISQQCVNRQILGKEFLENTARN